MQVEPPGTKVPLINVAIRTFEIAGVFEIFWMNIPQSASLIRDQWIVREPWYHFLCYKMIVEQDTLNSVPQGPIFSLNLPINLIKRTTHLEIHQSYVE